MKRLLAIVLLLCVLLIIAATTFWVGPDAYSSALLPYGLTADKQQSGEASGWLSFLEYFMSGNNSSTGDSVADTALAELALSLTENLDSDYEKMSAIYDWVTENIAYDLDKAKDVTAYGSGAKYLLENKRGVCHDYAELTLALLQAIGIEASYVKGEVNVSPG
ncbi:MAG: transglutaminase-like domain-containing protein, partial [Dethiobacteria bacterium]|nr:transglutaminase-like domain-containing protein [Dethiobacteria bacterium]